MKTLCNKNIEQAVRFLSDGQLVAIPTETVYGLAGNAMNTAAVMQIFATKQRPLFNPLILHTNSLEKAAKLTTAAGLPLLEKAMHFWPGPLTVLVPKSNAVHDLVTAGSPLVAIRIPDHSLTLQLLSILPFPLAAPSANLFGSISPTSPEHVLAQFDGKIAMVLDGGSSAVGLESTIIQQSEQEVTILRKGAVTDTMLQEHFEQKVQYFLPTQNNNQPQAPGMLKSHYAPGKPLYFGELEALMELFQNDHIAVLGMQLPKLNENAVAWVDLSPSGDLREAARNLFSALRTLDNSAAQVILAGRFPDFDLGMAINDRLERASIR